jgi:hypothetical protein
MGLSLQKFTADAETGRLLKQRLTQGLQVVELTPAEVDPSFITDRLAEPEDVPVRSVGREHQDQRAAGTDFGQTASQSTGTLSSRLRDIGDYA